MYTGSFIKSTPLLDGTGFEHAVIFITEHNTNGAIGFVINKPFARTLNQLEEFKHSIPFPLYDGGPVDKEHLFFIHQRPDIITGGTLVTNNIYVGGNFKQAVAHINNKTITSTNIKLFIGYCGWDDGELESEIAEGSWVVMEEGQCFSASYDILSKPGYQRMTSFLKDVIRYRYISHIPISTYANPLL